MCPGLFAAKAPVQQDYSQAVSKEIERSETSGTLTKSEADYLRGEGNKIKQREAHLKNERKGQLTASDQHELNNSWQKLWHRVHQVASKQADNTARNTGDTQTAPTPENQSNNLSDFEITRGIRRKLMSINDLSNDAKNVKIITQNKEVVLRGVVEDSAEKERVYQTARETAGGSTSINEITVKH